MITEEEFNRYEKVRKSGRTNMWNVANVKVLSGLQKERIMEIMKNYGTLKDKFTYFKKSDYRGGGPFQEGRG